MDIRSTVSGVIKYNVSPCPGCGNDISVRFQTHLANKSALPGDAGQYKCPLCGEPINYILSSRAVVDVLPYKRSGL